MSYAQSEWEQRIKLAAVYRAFARLGMDDLIYTHLSARVPGPDTHFLINPFGLMYEEVTASNLVKIDLEGNKVNGDNPHEINTAGYIIHSAVHEALPQAHCVMHLHTDHGVAVSAQRDGLLPLTQFNVFHSGGVAYHDYEGVALDPEEKARLVADLGQCRMMLLRNHGSLSVGRTVPEAFRNSYYLEKSCDIQVAAQSLGDEIILMDEGIVEDKEGRRRAFREAEDVGRMEWDAMIRQLDRNGSDHRR